MGAVLTHPSFPRRRESSGPAFAGQQSLFARKTASDGIPAFAGMTGWFGETMAVDNV
jgi:hypothetical protein